MYRTNFANAAYRLQYLILFDFFTGKVFQLQRFSLCKPMGGRQKYGKLFFNKRFTNIPRRSVRIFFFKRAEQDNQIIYALVKSADERGFGFL